LISAAWNNSVTMNNIFWALLAIFLVAALMRMDWAYYLVYVVGGVWVFSHWWVRRSLAHLRMTRQIAHYAFTNEHTSVRIELDNQSWLPLPWLQIQEAVPLELKEQDDYRTIVSLGGRTRLVHNYMLYCRRRGYYTVGPLSLRTSDLFGFVEARWEETGSAEFIVYPQIVPLERLGLPSRMPFGVLGARRQLIEDPARLSGVRTYAAGDSLRRIHWKATAHEDVLLVKKFQPSQDLPVSIVLDLDREAYPVRVLLGASEWAISVAASLAGHLSEQRQAVGLVANGSDPLATGDALPAITPHTGREHLMSVWRLLARIQINSAAQPLPALITRHTASLPWGATLIVVTPRLDEATLWVLHNAYRRGANVLALICADQSDFRTLQARGKQLGVHLFHTVWERDLQAVAT
jgi:uncharacterized protein (DUF58 family)